MGAAAVILGGIKSIGRFTGVFVPVMIVLYMLGAGLVIVMTGMAPAEIIGIAYDSGGVTTSTVTVPLVAALGVGLAASVSERNPMVDGFGLIALASLTPIIFVLGYGMVVEWLLS